MKGYSCSQIQSHIHPDLGGLPSLPLFPGNPVGVGAVGARVKKDEPLSWAHEGLLGVEQGCHLLGTGGRARQSTELEGSSGPTPTRIPSPLACEKDALRRLLRLICFILPEGPNLAKNQPQNRPQGRKPSRGTILKQH